MTFEEFIKNAEAAKKRYLDSDESQQAAHDAARKDSADRFQHIAPPIPVEQTNTKGKDETAR